MLNQTKRQRDADIAPVLGLLDGDSNLDNDDGDSFLHQAASAQEEKMTTLFIKAKMTKLFRGGTMLIE